MAIDSNSNNSSKAKVHQLLDRYQGDIEAGNLQPDSAQASAIGHLSRLAMAIEQRELQRPKSNFAKWRANRKRDSEAEPDIRGLYFWGGVGRGKTYLMDLFFDCLIMERKLRLHFHRFMQRVHNELQDMQGESDPLEKIASKFAKQYRVICLDEFFVKDITDAMILAGLLKGLFKRGVVLVTTSNIVPSGLYENGLQRDKFLPAIALLEGFTEVVNVDGGVDYRLRALEQAELFHHPLDAGAKDSLLKSFDSLAPEPGKDAEVIEILGRELSSVRCADDVVWFEFAELCDGPRSQNDYIELAKLYHAVLISNVPVMSVKNDDQARRFINLIDEFYDRSVKVIISAEVGIDSLYEGGRLSFEFERTQSRLLEMQSKEYLAKEHLA